jgi:hypothetical protein
VSGERFKERFDGAAAFADLSPEMQTAIGAVAMEIVVMWNGQDAYGHELGREKSRPFDAGDSALLDHLHTLVGEAIPEVLEAEPLPVPSLIGLVCRRCGCTEHDACVHGCSWVEDNLCSACAPGGQPA